MMNTNHDRVRFRHDCEKCYFVGFLGKYDLYLCVGKDEYGQPDPFHSSLVLRYGDEGWEYISNCVACVNHKPHDYEGMPVLKAFDHCKSIGLLKPMGIS